MEWLSLEKLEGMRNEARKYILEAKVVLEEVAIVRILLSKLMKVSMGVREAGEQVVVAKRDVQTFVMPSYSICVASLAPQRSLLAFEFIRVPDT